MDRHRPIIGVTRPSVGDMLSYLAIALGIRLAGGRPVRLSSTTWEGVTLDGLVLSGGSDVFPKRFQTLPKAGYRYDHPREQMELALLERALAEDLPILGICRGAQLMNVAAGGSLHMDVAERFHPTPYPQHWFRQIHFRKVVSITPGSRLHAILGCERLWVNSIHSQAVDRLGTGLTICAREANGVPQAIERTDRDFSIGVQFHPELLLHRRPFRRLFEALVLSAKARQRRWRSDAPGVQEAAGLRRDSRDLHRFA
ncbi:gamma-glutamyl-gamma-aminobutyrate hydrolase family protein [Caulobacter sp.]|uniref:gamma-glutamyl-gamma-aminobutyrate hydrolase family protein n=1 Tax=Caulobacter sp. TaxID=78 RepID=UPI0025C2C7FE|nr:gamma-glutamyl-gamma-aminobutyrate hydrolase family protein [Caulobacter sp.]